MRAGISLAPLDYPWSSYAHHTGVRVDGLVTDHLLYWGMGNTPFQREAAYSDLVMQGIPQDEVDFVTNSVLKNQPLGSDTFKAELERKTSRQILPAKRGRPFREPIPPLSQA